MACNTDLLVVTNLTREAHHCRMGFPGTPFLRKLIDVGYLFLNCLGMRHPYCVETIGKRKLTDCTSAELTKNGADASVSDRLWKDRGNLNSSYDCGHLSRADDLTVSTGRRRGHPDILGVYCREVDCREIESVCG